MADLKVRPGDWILLAWEALGDWMRGLRIVPGPGIRVSEGPHGTQVTAIPEEIFRSPYEVTLSGTRVRVAPGTLAGERVMMAGGYLDQKKADGISPAPMPVLEIRERPAAGQAFTWVALHPPRQEGKVRIPPQVTHETVLSPSWQPLAVLVWAQQRPLRAIQIVHHDLNFATGRAEQVGAAVAGAAAAAGQPLPAPQAKVYFWAV